MKPKRQTATTKYALIQALDNYAKKYNLKPAHEVLADNRPWWAKEKDND